MSPHVKFTPSVLSFCRERATEMYPDELLTLVNREFNSNLSENIDSFTDSLRRHKIYCKKKKRKVRPGLKRKSKFTQEHFEWLKKNVKGCAYKKLATQFNETFNTGFTGLQIRSYCHDKGLHNGLPSRDHYYKLGDSYFNDRGFEMIKVSMTGKDKERWRPKHHLVWESVNGPVPKDHKVIFADRDKTNFELDNLILIPRNVFASVHLKGFYSHNADLTKAGIAVEMHMRAINNAVERRNHEGRN